MLKASPPKPGSGGLIKPSTMGHLMQYYCCWVWRDLSWRSVLRWQNKNRVGPLSGTVWLINMQQRERDTETRVSGHLHANMCICACMNMDTYLGVCHVTPWICAPIWRHTAIAGPRKHCSGIWPYIGHNYLVRQRLRTCPSRPVIVLCFSPWNVVTATIWCMT